MQKQLPPKQHWYETTVWTLFYDICLKVFFQVKATVTALLLVMLGWHHCRTTAADRVVLKRQNNHWSQWGVWSASGALLWFREGLELGSVCGCVSESELVVCVSVIPVSFALLSRALVPQKPLIFVVWSVFPSSLAFPSVFLLFLTIAPQLLCL